MRTAPTTVAAVLLTAVGAHAEGCTKDHELYRVVTEYRAVLLDGGDIKRVMFVDFNDDRLKSWKPGHNITFCADENKMINTTINSIATLVSEIFTTCEPLLISNAIDRYLEDAWDWTHKPNGNPSLFVAAAKSQLGWYYIVCTNHISALSDEKYRFEEFLYVAASLMRINMTVEDPANSTTYKARSDKYLGWRAALYEAESKKNWTERIWQWFFVPADEQ
jgi:hypothetical protein